MAINWFSQPKASNVDDLIKRKKYAQAIEVIKVAVKKRPGDKRLLRRLADVLVLAGLIKDAVKVLNTLADEVALRGNAVEAIAILKKIQKLAPGQPEVEEKLAYYITHKSKKKAKSEWEMRGRPQAPDNSPAPRPAGPDFGMEEMGEDPGIELGSAEPEPPPVKKAPKKIALTPPVPRADTAPMDALPDAVAADGSKDLSLEEFSENELRDELQSLFEEVLAPLDEAAAAAEAERITDEAAGVQTPLFQKLAQAELLEVIRGLNLESFEPGEIIVSEGQPGDSLFVITRGTVRAYVKAADGSNSQVRELREGDFFGEIAVLQGGARTATITAALPCEMLVMDKSTLDEISKKHPHVREVMQAFQDERSGSGIEAAVRKRPTS